MSEHKDGVDQKVNSLGHVRTGHEVAYTGSLPLQRRLSRQEWSSSGSSTFMRRLYLHQQNYSFLSWIDRGSLSRTEGFHN